MLKFRLSLVFLIFAIIVATATAAAQPVTEADYRALVKSLLDTASSLAANKDTSGSAATFHQDLSQLRRVRDAAPGSLNSFIIENSWINELSFPDVNDAAALAAYLEAVQSKLTVIYENSMTLPPAAETDEIYNKAASVLPGVLAAPEFNLHDKPTLYELIQKLKRRLLLAIVKVLEWLDLSDVQARHLKMVANIIVVLALLLVVAVVGVYLYRNLHRNWPRSRPQDAFAIKEQISPSQALKLQAARAAAAGDLATGMRFTYLSLVAALEEKEALPPNRALTNWEYMALLSVSSADAGEILSRLNRIFDKCIYGERGTDAETFAEFTRLADSLTERI